MGVMTTQEAEYERLRNRNLTWEYHSSDNYDWTVAKAKELGWKENNVQVRIATNGEQVTYLIEPYEGNCDCPNIMKYRD